jgi:ribosomal protein L1
MTQILAGYASFSKEKLIENIRARADGAQKSRPAGAFGASRCRFPTHGFVH